MTLEEETKKSGLKVGDKGRFHSKLFLPVDSLMKSFRENFQDDTNLYIVTNFKTHLNTNCVVVAYGSSSYYLPLHQFFRSLKLEDYI